MILETKPPLPKDETTSETEGVPPWDHDNAKTGKQANVCVMKLCNNMTGKIVQSVMAPLWPSYQEAIEEAFHIFIHSGNLDPDTTQSSDELILMYAYTMVDGTPAWASLATAVSQPTIWRQIVASSPTCEIGVFEKKPGEKEKTYLAPVPPYRTDYEPSGASSAEPLYPVPTMQGLLPIGPPKIPNMSDLIQGQVPNGLARGRGGGRVGGGLGGGGGGGGGGGSHNHRHDGRSGADLRWLDGRSVGKESRSGGLMTEWDPTTSGWRIRTWGGPIFCDGVRVIH